MTVAIASVARAVQSLKGTQEAALYLKNMGASLEFSLTILVRK